MYKNHQKWTALLAALTFAWLLQVSAMPLAAVDTTEQVAAASAGQATGFIEQEGDDWERAMPRTAPILLILGVVALSLILSADPRNSPPHGPRMVTGKDHYSPPRSP